jgi:hypothetical protein
MRVVDETENGAVCSGQPSNPMVGFENIMQPALVEV